MSKQFIIEIIYILSFSEWEEINSLLDLTAEQLMIIEQE